MAGALLGGDGAITPASSGLGAIEGLTVVTPALEQWVVPLAVVIISGLFFVQRWGTAGVGRIFGPVTTVWFLCIAILGIGGIAHNPEVLQAISPHHALAYFLREGWAGFIVMGAVVLVVTGGEALYADMGHFGPRPIRLAWFGVVLPALLLNYFGQGAWLLEHPEAVHAANFNPFYSLVPEWAMVPMIIVATSAAVVASQALISGAYSLTQQAMQLGFAPRMHLIHTSHTEKGQIYMPGLNAALWAACIALVLAFRSSSALAATYGVAVSGTMLTTSVLFGYVMWLKWRRPLWVVLLLGMLFVGVDAAFLGSNLLKVPHGGWFPIAVAAVVFLLMTTWKRGRRQVTAILRESSLPLDLFIPDIARRKPHRVPGLAVFMTSIPDVAPSVLLHHLKHNKVLHQKVVLMTVESEEIPQVEDTERVTVEPKGEGFYEVIARYGFMETPDVPAVLARIGGELRDPGEAEPPSMKLSDITFYLGRETLIIRQRGGGAPRASGAMAAWRARLFGVMSRNAQSATAFFGLPPNRVVELGAQIQV